MGGDELDNSEDNKENEYGGGQTFKDKKTLNLLMKQASVKMSFNYITVKSIKKYLRVILLSGGWSEHVLLENRVGFKSTNTWESILVALIMSRESTRMSPWRSKPERDREDCIWGATLQIGLLEILDDKHHCEEHSLRYARAWICSASHIFICFNGLNPESINSLIIDEESGRFIYYFMAFGASIRGYAHMRKVIAIDGTHLSSKYKGVLLSAVAQDTQNHIYPLAYCVGDKENNASWGLFFKKLKAFVVDEPELCIIFDKNVSITNGLTRHYPVAHHGVCMRHLGENLLTNHHCSKSLYLYYHAAKAYTLEKFNDYFNALKERCPSVAACLEHEVGFEKWSRAHFLGNRLNVMTSNIAESLNSMLCNEREYPMAAIFNSIAHRFGEIFRKRYAEVDNPKTTFIPVSETILRENMTEGDKLYVKNINGSTDEFTVLGYGRFAKVNILRQSCSCRKYDLVKLSYAHAMAALYLKHGNEYDTSIYNYSSQIYSKESYVLAYLEPICTAQLESEWSVAREYLKIQVFPPDFDLKLGRRKVKRVKGVLEPSRYKKRNKCSKCKRPGHKRTTCSLNIG
ncbi:uncharacterized protein LOC107857744 [Capsicum annuum]|uniref:uncharacterized protein LOC107857744 n=1 Tax=Capsicum annuum TaxID=4072 RepID=UPI001FB0C96F|nr:uncharacterized protein LOC107857744 [Capsicum annuum]